MPDSMHRAQPALLQSLLHAAYRTPARHHPDAAALGRMAEGFHDIVSQEIRQQDHQLRARRQLQGFLLVRGIAPADVMRNRNIVALQQVRNIPQPVGAHYHRAKPCRHDAYRSEEHTSELQSLMRISYAVLCLKKKTTPKPHI